MKYSWIILGLFLILFTVIGCNISADDGGPKFSETSVTGRVFDSIRNRGYSRDSISLTSIFSCGSGSSYASCIELVETTLTDANGYYNFDFDYNRTKGYRVHHSSEHSYYEASIDQVTVVPGEENVINFIGWRPVIFNVEAIVTNNVFPDLSVQTRDDKDFDFDFSFPFFRIPDQNITTVLSLHGKPHTTMSIIFSYKDNNPNKNYHQLREIIYTQAQDSIDLSFKVDCSQF